jgi:hypothetical protein
LPNTPPSNAAWREFIIVLRSGPRERLL